ncbi:hypothetical protein OG921_22495 [Aldersonia sp. NBC_00410]|uniref:hypothetical protein n=1 Tax=Aldersonia sp. NBC_00410 TaxID=2975954 RepID=UPI002254591B|nr:hypothetical protein [Aldersonia sp. NBC_00410]MCX5045943.1 hypothetical protein [Aldersonia sp. NBC_00410]
MTGQRRGAAKGSAPGWLGRLLRRKRTEVPLDPDRGDLVVVVDCTEDAEACSTALERGADGAPAWRPDEQAVLRHHLRVPAGAVDTVTAIAGQDGYLARIITADQDPVQVDLYRVQLLDALHCSQERSRMAGLAQRHGGDVTGWDALQPGSGAAG